MSDEAALQASPTSGALSVIGKLAGILLSRAAGSLGNFALVWFVARAFGASASGLLFACISVGYVTAQLFNLGLSRFILRDLSLNPGNRDLTRACQQAGMVLSGLLLVAGLGCWLWIIGEPDWPMVEAFSVGIALGGFMLFQLVNADILKAGDRPNLAVLIELSLLPWATILFAAIGFALGFRGTMVPVYAAFAGGLAITALVIARVHALPFRDCLTAPVSAMRALVTGRGRTLAVFWLSGLVVVLASRITGLAAPFYGSAAEAGVLAVSVGLASLGGTIIHAAQGYFAPRFSRLSQRRDRDGLRRALVASQVVCTFAFLVVAFPCLLAPETVLSVFGPEFHGGGELLMLMVAAQLVRSLGGCSEMFLAMTGRGAGEAGCLIASMVVFTLVLFLSQDGIEAVARAYAAMIVARGILATGLGYVGLWRLGR